MDENDIKVEVLTWIRRACRGRSLPVVTSEFSLNGTGIRADLAVLDNAFHGIEIKSAVDTLKRLPSQMEGYARYFDRTILVVAPKHLRAVTDLDLHGVQVWSQSALAEQRMHRRGYDNRVAGHTLLGLLTAEEERRAIRAMEVDDTACQATVLNDQARNQFEKAFRRRYDATSSNFWKAVQGRAIRRDDLSKLSRFQPERQRLRDAAAEEAARWAKWAIQMKAAALPA